MIISWIITVIGIIIVFSIIVLVHELGHYLMCRKFNIKVLEFGFGIPPRLWGKKIGETIYSINWFPIGGFVQPLGEDDVDPKALQDPRSFATQNVWKRVIVVVAGVVMNFILAFVVYYIFLAMSGFKTQLPLIVPHKFVGVEQTQQDLILVSDVVSGSPAQNAGIKVGDGIVAFNSSPVTDGQMFIDETRQSAGQPIQLTLEDLTTKARKTVSLTPRINPPKDQGALGIAIDSETLVNLNYAKPWQKLLAGPIHSWNIIDYSVAVLGKFISTAIAQHNPQVASYAVGGPIAIGVVSHQIFEQPDWFAQILNLIAGISLSLGIVNVLPIPALDGGRLFFLLIEGIFRKKIDPNLEKKIHTVGMVVLLTLSVLIAFSDVNNYVLGH